MNGIIIINKPKGITSFDVVYKLRKIFNEKVGHTGTLDPMARGVLPILIGSATKCSKYLINHDKEYEVVLKLGIKTDTADCEGKILEEQTICDDIFNEDKILEALAKNKGKIMQKPPMYSAIKVNGKKLYEYARKGENIEVRPREVNIYDLELLEINKSDKKIKFKVKCSKGTYIRSLCEKIAEDLGTIGYMYDLLRTKVGEFSIAQAISQEKIEEAIENIENKEKFEQLKLNLKNKCITIEEMFNNLESINLDEIALSKFLNGVKLKTNKKDGVYKIYNNKFIGLGTVNNYLLKRDIII